MSHLLGCAYIETEGVVFRLSLRKPSKYSKYTATIDVKFEHLPICIIRNDKQAIKPGSQNQKSPLVTKIRWDISLLSSKLHPRYNNLAGGCDIAQELENWTSECNNLTSGCVLVQELDNLVFWWINLAKHMLGEFFHVVNMPIHSNPTDIPYNIEFNLKNYIAHTIYIQLPLRIFCFLHLLKY